MRVIAPNLPQQTMPIGSTAIRMMTEGGTRRVSADSLQGQLGRPVAQGWAGNRVATLERLFDFFINNVPDPDTAMSQDPNFDEKMRQQPDVHATLRLRELTVAGLPWSMKASSRRGSDPVESQAMADYVKDIFDDMVNFRECIRQMQTAVGLGGQGHEWVWKRDYSGREWPVEFWPIHKSNFCFDRLGNMAILSRETPVWGSYVSMAPTQINSQTSAFPTPPGLFTYHKYMSEGGAWHRPAGEGFLYWGRGEDCNLYLPVTFDAFVLRFRMRWLEKYGLPPTILYYPDNDPLASEIVSIAKSLREEAIITIPKKVGADGKNYFYEIDQLNPPTMTNDAFADFSQNWTKPAVEKIILGGANLMEVGDTGSYGATVDQRDAGSSIVFRWDTVNIEATINYQLIPAIIHAVPKWRNVPLEHMPKFTLTPEESKNRLDEMEIVEKAAALAPVREEDVYSASGLQKPKDGSDGSKPDKTIFLGQQQGQPDEFGNFPKPGEPPMTGQQPPMPGSDPNALLGGVHQNTMQGKAGLRPGLRSFSQKKAPTPIGSIPNSKRGR